MGSLSENLINCKFADVGLIFSLLQVMAVATLYNFYLCFINFLV